MNHEFMEALDELEKDRGIDKEILIDTIEQALLTAYKKNFGSAQNVRVEIDRERGDVRVFSQRVVVDESDLYDTFLEIELNDAREISPNYELGDIIENEVTPKDFGRIAAQTAKQVVVQRIREASREVIFSEFNEKKGEIVSGIVQKVDKNIVVLDLGKIEGIMPIKEQIPTEHYYVNQKLRACIANVEKGAKGSTQIIVSRANNDFLRKLFELEIPEIYEGLIEIKSISRDPGKRCKVAVYSPNENIDPVGSCVGQKGIRIQNIINELSGEKIDVIEWNEDPSTYIAEALLPAKVMAVDIKDEERFAQVIVPDDQLSLAIGKAGQNARLAAKLTNWKIDIKSESQFREMIQELQANGEEKEEAESEEVADDVASVDETNVEEANEVENVETSEENKDEE